MRDWLTGGAPAPVDPRDSLAGLRVLEAARRSAATETVIDLEDDRMSDLKMSLGIWALGPMVTRFVPGGYQPEHADESTAQKVARAVEGLGDLMDDYEFHYPQELSEDNLDEVRDALDGHGIYTICTGTHLEPALRQGRAVLARRRDPRRGARRGAARGRLRRRRSARR